MCDHEGKPCPGKSCRCVCDNCVLGDDEAEQAWEAEQDRQQIMHDEMINDELAQDGRWG